MGEFREKTRKMPAKLPPKCYLLIQLGPLLISTGPLEIMAMAKNGDTKVTNILTKLFCLNFKATKKETK